MSRLPDFLRYASDDEPGLSRCRDADGFSYFDSDGTRVTDTETLARIDGLGLPPAYEDVWVCADGFGHIQATGRDAAGRKQYRYHALWRSYRDRMKFDHLVDFADALPRIRARMRRDLRRDSDDKRFVCAALVRLIDRGALRVGNRHYTHAGGAVGATTLRRQHVRFVEGGLQLDYTAKGGKRVRKSLRDRTLARILQDIDDLPGRALFQYVNDGGTVVRLDSADVNDYLGEDFTAKTFRTWHGTVAAFGAARSIEKPTLKDICEAAARRLHNTPAICRNSYIHPRVIAIVEDSLDPSTVTAPKARNLREVERACRAWIAR